MFFFITVINCVWFFIVVFLYKWSYCMAILEPKLGKLQRVIWVPLGYQPAYSWPHYSMNYNTRLFTRHRRQDRNFCPIISSHQCTIIIIWNLPSWSNAYVLKAAKAVMRGLSRMISKTTKSEYLIWLNICIFILL